MRAIALVTVGLVGSIVPTATAAKIKINTSSKLQRIDGFGFSQAFGRASEFQAADPELRKRALDLLFDIKTGAGFSIIRNWIPSTTALSIEPNSPGLASNKPNYTWDGDDEGQVWFTKQAVSYGVKTIYADAWSAPGYMKTNGDEATPGYLCGTAGHTCSTGDWRQAFANYLVQYVKFYKQEGLDITHLGFLNEPDIEVGYSQMQISPNAQEAISFIPTLYETVKRAHLDLSLTCCDAVGWNSQANYTNHLMATGMQRYLDIISSHMYSDDATFPLKTNLPTWLTEAGVETSTAPFTTTWYDNGALNEGMTWASKLAAGFVDAGLSAYLFWEGFEIGQNQSASHLIDILGDEPEPSSVYYAFTMWSRFIRPGANRVAVSGTLPNVIIAAFQNIDKSVIAIFTNSGSSSQFADIAIPTRKKPSAQVWLTDNHHRVSEINFKRQGSSIEVAIPPNSVITVKFTSQL
ncbi:cellulosome enzyme [Trichoderma harzianum]|uniref:Cellulosome enzyme n=1 Tax=Trichoderma harzianum TaxID=5544 RepID=A0A0F9X559_TRIHA|nr:cellulosome enzyme [Trichoderma harzianum]